MVRTLNTATDIEYLNEEEKKGILFINMARHDGPLFAETFLTAYMQENQLEKNSYTKSLHRDLKKTNKLVALMPEQDLTAVAQGHALKSGEKGTILSYQIKLDETARTTIFTSLCLYLSNLPAVPFTIVNFSFSYN